MRKHSMKIIDQQSACIDNRGSFIKQSTHEGFFLNIGGHDLLNGKSDSKIT